MVQFEHEMTSIYSRVDSFVPGYQHCLEKSWRLWDMGPIWSNLVAGRAKPLGLAQIFSGPSCLSLSCCFPAILTAKLGFTTTHIW